jgi:flagellar motility protein MotE (MotC chaperone)
MIPGLRLVDAVIIAAVALLSLKALGFFSGARKTEGGPVVVRAANAPMRAEDLPNFARVLAYARTNYLQPDVNVTGAVPEEKKAEASPSAPDQPEAKPAEPATGPLSPSERALLERLGERREELQQRAREIEVRERLLETTERKVEGRLNELKALEEKIDAAMTKRGDTEAGALRNLVIMYEAMKPKDAAKVFDRLAHDVLVPVVLQMKPAKMAEVLAAMSPEAAEKLTVALSNRAKGLPAGAAAIGAGALPPNELPAIEQPPATPPKR